jgi:Ca2+-binding RTX toxin-like protein
MTGQGYAYGGDGADTLVGGSYNDNLLGGDGADSVAGGAGHDNLVGGRGDDTVDGGPGSDFIAADPGDDVIDGGARATNPDQGGFYILRCGDWLYWKSPQGEFDPEDVELWLEPGSKRRTSVTIDLAAGTAASGATGNDTFASIESATGGAVGDVLRGTAEADCLYGYGGADQIKGRAGDDSLYSGRGSDHLDAGKGEDQIWLKSAAAHVRGGPGRDWTFWWGPEVIDMASGTVRAGRLRGTISGVEDVSGEYYRGPVIRGDSQDNRLTGHRVYGRGGDDQLRGNFADGGSGVDACDADREEHCELDLDVS